METRKVIINNSRRQLRPTQQCLGVKSIGLKLAQWTFSFSTQPAICPLHLAGLLPQTGGREDEPRRENGHTFQAQKSPQWSPLRHNTKRGACPRRTSVCLSVCLFWPKLRLAAQIIDINKSQSWSSLSSLCWPSSRRRPLVWSRRCDWPVERANGHLFGPSELAGHL